MSENGQSLLFKLLNNDPAQRPTAREALEHQWFSDERVLLNNLIHLNDFLSNAKCLPNKGSLMHASVSSLNLQNAPDNSGSYQNVPTNKKYDSFKVASNFFLRLRKDDGDIRNSMGKAINPVQQQTYKLGEEGSNKPQSKGNLNVSVAASNVASQGPDSGQ